MKSNRKEYIQFFTNWISYQYARESDQIHNLRLIREMERIVTDDEEAAYWGDRDCWTMHGIASQQIQNRAIEGVTA